MEGFFGTPGRFGREWRESGRASHRGHRGHRGEREVTGIGLVGGGLLWDAGAFWARIARIGESIAQRSHRSQRGERGYGDRGWSVEGFLKSRHLTQKNPIFVPFGSAASFGTSVAPKSILNRVISCPIFPSRSVVSTDASRRAEPIRFSQKSERSGIASTSKFFDEDVGYRK